jgi:hypothetical protein
MKRIEIFARDGYRCVYCGTEHPPEELTVDHVQPRMKGGDQSGGNVVTACAACNTAKGGQPLWRFLADHPDARRNFFARAWYVWPRHQRAVAEELARRGQSAGLPDFVEGVRGLRRSDATASLVDDGGTSERSRASPATDGAAPD